jgi:ABC-2 type transport system permease protein
MFSDIITIIQKDLKEVLSARGSRKSSLVYLGIVIGLIGVLMPIQSGQVWLSEPIVPLVWSWFPVFLMISMVTDSIAGERERNTLETLLASRLSDRAILFGKIAGAVIYGWSISVISNLLAVITVNLSDPMDGFQFYSFSLFLILLFLPLVLGILMSSLGVLVSLNAPTARSAYQKLSMVMLALWFIPMLIINFAPESFKLQINQFLSSNNTTQLATIGIVFLIMVNIGLIWLAMQRFQRTRLILD